MKILGMEMCFSFHFLPEDIHILISYFTSCMNMNMNMNMKYRLSEKGIMGSELLH